MSKDGHLNLNGHLLRTFLAIYDTNSVSKAAEHLDLNQSTVSYSLEKLRECLSDPLFVKVGRGIVPSDRAIMLAPHIRAQLAGLEGLTNSEIYLPEEDNSRVTIASNVTELLPQFERLYRSIREIAPRMPVRFLEMGSRQNINKLLESGKADLVVAASMKRYPAAVNTRRVFSAPTVCYYDPDVRGPVMSAEDYFASNHAALDFGGDVSSKVDQRLNDQSRTRKKLLLAPNVHALANIVRGTDLIITMHSGFKDNVFSHFLHCPPPIPMNDIEFDMIWHRRAENSGRNMWLRELAVKVMGQG